MLIYTIDYKSIKIEIRIYDDPKDSINWDNLGTMVCFHNRYNLGDKHEYEVEDLKDIVEDKDYISLPLYLYDHSGLTISTVPFSCRWDSGTIGYIIVSKEDIKKEYGWKVLTKKRIKQIETYLKNEVDTYNNYLIGNVYGYNVIDSNGESIDSCWGFNGDFEDSCIISEAKSFIDYHLKELKKVEIENFNNVMETV